MPHDPYEQLAMAIAERDRLRVEALTSSANHRKLRASLMRVKDHWRESQRECERLRAVIARVQALLPEWRGMLDADQFATRADLLAMCAGDLEAALGEYATAADESAVGK